MIWPYRSTLPKSTLSETEKGRVGLLEEEMNHLRRKVEAFQLCYEPVFRSDEERIAVLEKKLHVLADSLGRVIAVILRNQRRPARRKRSK